MWLWIVGLVGAAIGIVMVVQKWLQQHHDALYWEWDNGGDDVQVPRRRLDLDQLQFPASFLFGVATAAHQIEGGCDNNDWSRFETWTSPHTGKPTIKHDQRVGQAVDHWHRVKEDTALLEDLGCNSYRFSIEWSKVEPRRGEFDEQAIKHYHDEIDGLVAKGIEPMVTLFHFTSPLWFADATTSTDDNDKNGAPRDEDVHDKPTTSSSSPTTNTQRHGGSTATGWENEENVHLFVRFALRMFEEFGDKVSLWCTINEPVVFVNGGWLMGIFPPGKKDDVRLGRVLWHLLKAHCLIYEAVKGSNKPESPYKVSLSDKVKRKLQIGIVKDIFQFDPCRPWHPLDWLVSRQIDEAFNGSVLSFFETGVFSFSFPGKESVHETWPNASNTNDFIGLNYYSHFLTRFEWNLKQPFALVHPPHALMTDMPYTLYNEGLYRALVRLKSLGKPIYVTETGIADAADDKRRLFLRRLFFVLSESLARGIDVRGLYYWSLTDNFEWSEGYTMRFGLYNIEQKTLRRRLYDSSKYFRDVVRWCRGVDKQPGPTLHPDRLPQTTRD